MREIAGRFTDNFGVKPFLQNTAIFNFHILPLKRIGYNFQYDLLANYQLKVIIILREKIEMKKMFVVGGKT